MAFEEELADATPETPIKIFCISVERADPTLVTPGSTAQTGSCGDVVWVSPESRDMLAKYPWAETLCERHMVTEVMDRVKEGTFEGIHASEGTKREVSDHLKRIGSDMSMEEVLERMQFLDTVLGALTAENKERLQQEAQDKGESSD